MSINRFEGKVAIVTGGGSGIGAATARRIAEEGGKVVVTGRRQEPIEKIAKEVGGVALAGDVADVNHLNDAVTLAVKSFGGLDVLVNSAGTGSGGPILDLDLDEWKRVLDINLFAAIEASRVAIPAMRKRGGGSIVHVSSVSGMRSRLGGAIYESSKAALNSISRSLAVEFGIEGIRSNCVCPAVARSEMADMAYGSIAEAKGISLDELYADIGSVYALGRIAETKEVAAAIAFLASDDASFITATDLMVDGGGTTLNPSTFALKG